MEYQNFITPILLIIVGITIKISKNKKPRYRATCP